RSAMDRGAKRGRDAEFRVEARRLAGDTLGAGDCAGDGPARGPGGRESRAPRDDDRIADIAVNLAAEALDDGRDGLEHPVEDAEIDGIAVAVGERGRPHDVEEEE